ncbi:MAG: prepilin-type N-terminal cleavage/methylation domain-containing protein [Ectothiorhodospiraceae bacterium]
MSCPTAISLSDLNSFQWRSVLAYTGAHERGVVGRLVALHAYEEMLVCARARGSIMTSQLSSVRGFTLIELVILLVLLGILAVVAAPRFLNLANDAERTAVHAQARALITQDQLNRAACEVDSPDCIDIGKTGETACEDFIQKFLPQYEADRFEVTNIDSDTSREEWRNGLDDNEAVFQVTRFLGESEPPTDDWLEDWNPVQPCILSPSN